MTSDLNPYDLTWLQMVGVLACATEQTKVFFPGTQREILFSGIQQRTIEMVFSQTTKRRQEAEVSGNKDPATSENRQEGPSHLQLGRNEMIPTHSVQKYS